MVILHETVSATPQKYSEDVSVIHLSCMRKWYPPIIIMHIGIDFMDMQYSSDGDIARPLRGDRSNTSCDLYLLPDDTTFHMWGVVPL
jgi:hypothetical protein